MIKIIIAFIVFSFPFPSFPRNSLHCPFFPWVCWKLKIFEFLRIQLAVLPPRWCEDFHFCGRTKPIPSYFLWVSHQHGRIEYSRHRNPSRAEFY